MQDRRAISASTETYQNKQHRTSLDYRGISIASFRCRRPTPIPTPETILMHLIGGQSRRNTASLHGTIYRIGNHRRRRSHTVRPDTSNFSLAISSLANFPREKEREREEWAKVSRVYIHFVRCRRWGWQMCRMCDDSSASIMKFILWFPAGHFGKLSEFCSPAA